METINSKRNSWVVNSDGKSESILMTAAFTALAISIPLSISNHEEVSKMQFDNNHIDRNDIKHVEYSSSKVGGIDFTEKLQKTNQAILKKNNNNHIDFDIEKKTKETKNMQREIDAPILKFENFVTKLGFLLIFVFLLLSLPSFIGYPALVGVLMSVGLPIFIRLRKWERSE